MPLTRVPGSDELLLAILCESTLNQAKAHREVNGLQRSATRVKVKGWLRVMIMTQHG